MKRWEIGVLVFAILFFGFLFSRDFLARAAWQKYHSPATALVFASQDTKLLIQLGNYYFNGSSCVKTSDGQGCVYDLEKAKRAYEKALRVDSKILWGHYQLARIYFVEGDFRRALEEIEKELEANPENLRALYVRGLIYGYRGHTGLPAQAGDLVKAEEDFRRFTFWSPSEWAGYNDLAWILAKSGKYEESKNAIVRAFENVPNGKENSWLWNSLGVALLNLGKMSEAKAAFESALRYAEGITEEEWQKAYPGNNPVSAREGPQAFRNAIEENLRRVGAGIKAQ